MSAEKTYNALLDGLAAFDNALQRTRRIKDLSAETRSPNRCGECTKWMTKQCQREKSTMTGFSAGPVVTRSPPRSETSLPSAAPQTRLRARLAPRIGDDHMITDKQVEAGLVALHLDAWRTDSSRRVRSLLEAAAAVKREELLAHFGPEYIAASDALSKALDGQLTLREALAAALTAISPAALEAAEAAREPADFVMVPRELTTEMLDASESAAWATREQLGRDASFDSYLHAYVQAQWRAALKAAPKSAAPGSAEQPATVRVPLHLTPAMSEVISQEGWSWGDLLGAAEAIDEPTYAAVMRTTPGAPGADERDEIEIDAMVATWPIP